MDAVDEAIADATAAMAVARRPLELLNDLLGDEKRAEGRVEALRLTAKAAFEDWVEARFRAEAAIEETRSSGCRMRRL